MYTEDTSHMLAFHTHEMKTTAMESNRKMCFYKEKIKRSAKKHVNKQRHTHTHVYIRASAYLDMNVKKTQKECCAN